LVLPLLGLHKQVASIYTQDQVKAAVGGGQPGFFHGTALATESFAGQHFEVAPTICSSKAVHLSNSLRRW